MTPNEVFVRWVEGLAKFARFGPKDKLGTANLIDDRARRRAADAIRTGSCIDLARPIEEDSRGGLSPSDGRMPAVAGDATPSELRAYGLTPAFARGPVP